MERLRGAACCFRFLYVRIQALKKEEADEAKAMDMTEALEDP